MKSLEDLGKQVVVHEKYSTGSDRTVKCPCGLIHFTKVLPTTRFLDCRCGARVELCNQE